MLVTGLCILTVVVVLIFVLMLIWYGLGMTGSLSKSTEITAGVWEENG